MEVTQWRPVKGYEGFYRVSSTGLVKNIARGNGRRRGKILKQGFDARGYKTVTLSRNGHDKLCSVHRLVAAAFIGDITGLQVNHKDGVKSNNRILNLEICTNQENRDHAIATGLVNQKGENNPAAKITEDIVRDIRRLHAQGYGYKRLAKHFGLSWGCVRNVASGKTWKHVE